MNKLVITNLALFAAGAVLGSAVTYKVVKDKEEKRANEEIELAKESFKERYSEPVKSDEDDDELTEDDLIEIEDEEALKTEKEIKMVFDSKAIDDLKNEKSVIEYAKIISEERYETRKNEKEEEDDMDYNVPKIVSPEEFGENEEYEIVSLTYYADDVLTDEDDIPVPDDEIDDMIGYTALTSFGQYEDDSVFVRNDESETYYEILKDTRNYTEL